MVASNTTSFDYRLFEFISTSATHPHLLHFFVAPLPFEFQGNFCPSWCTFSYRDRGRQSDRPRPPDLSLPVDGRRRGKSKAAAFEHFLSGERKKDFGSSTDGRTDRTTWAAGRERESNLSPSSSLHNPHIAQLRLLTRISHLPSPVACFLERRFILGPRSTCEVQGNPAIPTPPPCQCEGPFTQPPSRFGGPSCRYL